MHFAGAFTFVQKLQKKSTGNRHLPIETSPCVLPLRGRREIALCAERGLAVPFSTKGGDTHPKCRQTEVVSDKKKKTNTEKDGWYEI